MENALKDARTPAYRTKLKELLEKSPNAQTERFKETARALGCDEDEAAFDEKLKAIARQKPIRPSKPPTND